MIRIVNNSVLLLILFSLFVLPGINESHAKGTWSPPDIIDPSNDPLEISAGRTFSNGNIYDTFIVLNSGPQTTLQVYNVDATQDGCVLVNESTIAGFDGPLFGSSHRILPVLPGFFSTSPDFYSCVVDDNVLKALKSSDGGLTWTIIDVSPNAFYSSCETIVDPFNPTSVTIGGCNFVNGRYDGFLWVNNNFQLDDQVNGVDCANQGAIRASASKIEGIKYVLHGDIQPDNTQEIRLNIGGNSNLIDLSIRTPLGTVAESFPPVKTGNGLVVGTYVNFGDDTIKGFKVRRGGKSPIDVNTVADAPAFNTFFGVSGFVSQVGVYDVIAPGGIHVQYSLNTHSAININTNGNFTNPNGPIAATQLDFNNLLQAVNTGIDVASIDIRAASMGNSVSCGQFFLEPFSIPTLSEWGLIALSGALLLSGAYYLRRKKVF